MTPRPGCHEKGETVKILHTSVAALCACGFAASANAEILFSFSANSNPDGPTLWGDPAVADGGVVNQLFDAAPFNADNAVNVTLSVDVNGHDPGGVTNFNTRLVMPGATTSSYVRFDNGSVFTHNWIMSGSFALIDVLTQEAVLTVAFDNAQFTSFSGAGDAMGATAALQGSEGVDANLSFTPGAALQGLGINDLSVGESFAFAISNIMPLVPLAGEVPTVGIDQTGNWLNTWVGDASFSASASIVPGPGALIAMAGGLACWRRRRRVA